MVERSVLQNVNAANVLSRMPIKTSNINFLIIVKLFTEVYTQKRDEGSKTNSVLDSGDLEVKCVLVGKDCPDLENIIHAIQGKKRLPRIQLLM